MVDSGLLYASILDGRGGGRVLQWPEIRGWRPDQGLLWLHFDYGMADVQDWLANESGLDLLTREALTGSNPRPRALIEHDRLLLILRGVNRNPGANPEDMVAIRCWITPERVITLRHRRLLTAQEIRDALEAGRGPRSASEFLGSLCDRLTEHISGVVQDLDDQVDGIETTMLTTQDLALRSRIAELRREAVELRRYLAPQREVLTRLQHELLPWLDAAHRARLREVGERMMRNVEELDAARERAAVVQDELMTRLSDQMNRNMYVLSLITAVFLPLGLVTGLLGVNVAGMPGTDWPPMFWLLCGVLAGLAVAQWWWFRRRGWVN